MMTLFLVCVRWRVCYSARSPSARSDWHQNATAVTAIVAYHLWATRFIGVENLRTVCVVTTKD
jgi:hypothetical protein